MEPLACCVRAVKRAGIRPSDVVVVVGLGSIGLLSMQLIRHAGGKCIDLDLDPARRELADSLRSTATFAGSEPDFEESLASMTNGRGLMPVLLTAETPPTCSDGVVVVTRRRDVPRLCQSSSRLRCHTRLESALLP